MILFFLHCNRLLFIEEKDFALCCMSAYSFFLYITGQLLGQERSTDDKGLVLLDARNLYETRIGKFLAPSVETLDPSIRQYSDLPSWIDNNAEKLRGKNILM